MENTEVNTRLVINLREGVVEVQGSEEFVRSIYDDFKERISSPIILQPATPENIIANGDEDASSDSGSSRKKRQRKTRDTENGKSKTDYKPLFNTQLNLGGLEAFYDQFEPTNNFEKILIFSTYLRDHLKIEPCTANDIYSCFFTLKQKTKIPEAFVQAFRDAQHRSHFIEFVSFEEIRITIAGDNHFHQKLKKKGASE